MAKDTNSLKRIHDRPTLLWKIVSCPDDEFEEWMNDENGNVDLWELDGERFASSKWNRDALYEAIEDEIYRRDTLMGKMTIRQLYRLLFELEERE